MRGTFFNGYLAESSKLSAKYEAFAQGMSHYGYSWEAVEVTTEDGAVCTMFHITGKHGSEWYKSSRPEIPVLLMPSAWMDAATYLNALRATEFGESKNTPYPLAIWDEGFDVWIGNQRGTRYSNPGNQDTDLYWDVTQETHAKDAVAFIKAIKEATGRDKVNYIGHEHGNAIAAYAMAQDTAGWWKENVNKVIALEPCFLLTLAWYDTKEEQVKDEDGKAVIDPLTDAPMTETTIVDWDEEKFYD